MIEIIESGPTQILNSNFTDSSVNADPVSGLPGGNIQAVLQQLWQRSVNNAYQYLQVSGQFLLDPNEVNGWGVIGMYDNSNTQDLGNADSLVLNRASGGPTWPIDMEVVSYMAVHANSNQNARAFGWVLGTVENLNNANSSNTKFIVHEAMDNNDVGPRNYGNTNDQKTNIDVTLLKPTLADRVVPAGHTLTLAAAAPTAVGTNYYVRIQSGLIVLRPASETTNPGQIIDPVAL